MNRLQELLKDRLPCSLTPEDRIRRDNLWTKFDRNGNNVISYAEFEDALSREIGGIASFPRAVKLKAFEAARAKTKSQTSYGDNYVSRKEFRYLMKYLRQYQECWLVFNKADVDQNARISKEEFLQAKPRLESLGLDISNAESQWQQIDRDKTGQLHFYEFAHWAITKTEEREAELNADAEESKYLEIRVPAARGHSKQSLMIDESENQNSNNPPNDDYNRKKAQFDSIISKQNRLHDLSKKKGASPQKLKLKTQQDTYLELRDENIQLKKHQSVLEEDVKLIATKLKRQINQLKKDKLIKFGGANGQFSKIDEDLDQMIDKNFQLQEEERQLRKDIKKLQGKKQGQLAGMSNTVRKLESAYDEHKKPPATKMYQTASAAMHQATQQQPGNQATEFLFDLENMRLHIAESNRTIEQLKVEIESSKSKFQTSGQQPASEDLKVSLRQKELQVAQQKAQLEELADSLKVRTTIFTDKQAFHDQLVEELKNLNTEQLRLQSQARSYEDSEKQTEYLMKRVEEARMERDRLQRDLDTLTRQPFFKREADQSTFKTISDLEKKIQERENGIRDAKETILKADEKLRQLADEQREIKGQRELYKDEIDRLSMTLDPSSMSLADIQKKIHDLDPSLFRQVMKDLHYDGEDPKWAKFDFLEKLKLGPNNQPYDETDPVQLKREIENLKIKRRDLAAELDQVQNLLRMQVGIDKESAYIHQQEIEQLKSQIALDNRQITDLNALIAQRNSKLIAYTQQLSKLPGQTLTQENLAKIDMQVSKMQKIHRDEDMLSEFSVVTDETEINPQENFLDLLVSRAQFHRDSLGKILGSKEMLPAAVQTFVTVGFFNHDTRNSELAEGFDPNYATQFSFKNQVDDFYLQFLEKNTLTLEFFITRAQNAIKIGTAKIVLQKLIDKDTTFQAQQIVYEGNGTNDGNSISGGLEIGKIYFKMRMRKPIDEALRWYNQKRALRMSRDPMTIAQSNNLKNKSANLKPRFKLVTIQVLKCMNLKRIEENGLNSRKEMQPFYHYSFYTFEYTSPIARGNSPQFDIKQTYKTELTEQFIDFMRTQVLKIDLIDESVDLKEGNGDPKDYIGSVRIPLNNFNVSGSESLEIADNFPVRDANGNETGRMEVKVSCRDVSGLMDGSDDTMLGAGDTFIMSKFAEKEVITKIAERFAGTLMESIDMIFDMLIEPGSFDASRITKQRFRDYVLNIADNLRDQDVDIMLKTHPMLAGKDFIDLKDFRTIFEIPVQQARNRKAEELAEREKTFLQAQRFFKSNGMNVNPPSLSLTQTVTADARNPFLENSINQRMNDTPAFQLGQPAMFAQQILSPKQQISLAAFLKEEVYSVINVLREFAKKQNFVDFETYKQAMLQITQGKGISEQDIAKFWNSYNLNGRFYFEEQLMQMYGASQVQQVRVDTAQYRNYLKKVSDPNLIRIKEKLQEHLIKMDLSLDHLFEFLDADFSKQISIEEFTKGLSSVLNPEECRNLFIAIDMNENNSLTREEIILSLQPIHTAYILYKLCGQLDSSKGQLTPDKIFSALDSNENGEMEVVEFGQMMELQFSKINKYEIDALFSHFDKKGLGKITVAEFKQGLNEKVELAGKMRFYLHDFMLPLITIVKKNKLDAGTIFELFSKGDKTKLTINDLKEVIRFYLKIDLTDEEEKMLNQTIMAFYSITALTKEKFNDFLSKNFNFSTFDKGSEALAKTTQNRVRLALRGKMMASAGMNLEVMLRPYLDQATKQVTMRSLKMFLTVTIGKCLSPYEIECLVDHLDPDHDGFISIEEITRDLGSSNI